MNRDVIMARLHKMNLDDRACIIALSLLFLVDMKQRSSDIEEQMKNMAERLAILARETEEPEGKEVSSLRLILQVLDLAPTLAKHPEIALMSDEELFEGF